MSRRRYLDWLRGVAVLIMIEAHTLDAWTRAADRERGAYKWALIAGGIGAPIFLFLAGIALALAAGARRRKGLTEREVTSRALRRGLQIFAFAFLFRLQSMVISGGSLESILKVDILNVLGLAMIGGAVLWALGRGSVSRAVLLSGAAVALAMFTPPIRSSAIVGLLPDPIEWYLRPSPGRTTFSLFPWAGFLLAGGAVGVWLDATHTREKERSVLLALGAIGAALTAGAYYASFLPPIYAQTEFWTTSPTFFFLRLGILIAALPVAYAWNEAPRPAGGWWGWSPVQEFGIASLFVYWIHVEMVYGIPSAAIHRRLSFEQALVALALFTLFLFALVKLKERLWDREGGPLRSAWQSRRGRTVRSA